MNIIIPIDIYFQDKFHDHFSSTPYYTPPKDGGPCFTFTHYAGPVSHNTVVCGNTLKCIGNNFLMALATFVITLLGYL